MNSPPHPDRDGRHSNARFKSLERHVDELYDLLNASREMSNILNPVELYADLTGIIHRKLGVKSVSVYIFSRQSRSFDLAYQNETGELNREFMLDELEAFWKKLLDSEPFQAYDQDGRAVLPEVWKGFGFSRPQTELLVPMVMRSKVVGFLTLGSKKDGAPYRPADLNYLKHIASHAAVCINTSKLYLKRQKEKEELDRTLYNLSLLYSIGRAMTYISDLKSLLEYILNQAIEITGAEKGSIMLYDIEKNLLSIRVLAGLRDKAYQKKVNNNEIKCRTFQPGEGIAGRVFQSARPMVVAKASEEERFVEADTSYVRSIACIPMMVYSDVIGVINVTNKLEESGFTDEDVELLKAVADQAAVAINKAQLWEMAVTDSLTGLFVRRYFMVKFQEEFHRAERYQKILSIVMADLDHFKKINDTYGHSAGDRVLKIVAKYLQRNVRDVDVVARYGGEEFVILLPEADKEEALTVAERLRQKLQKLEIDGLPRLTISLGIASYPADSGDIDILIKKADAAMYAAKQAGRNRVLLYREGMELTISDQRHEEDSSKASATSMAVNASGPADLAAAGTPSGTP